MNDKFYQHRSDALRVWNYHQLGMTPIPRDVGLGLGSHDLGVAEHAARLYHQGLFPILVFSGATSPTTKDVFPEGEAVAYRQRAIELGVPADVIFVEKRATNTGENFSFTREMLDARGIRPSSALVISKPYMERRALATSGKVWPEIEVTLASDGLTYEDYVESVGDEKLVIDMIVGDLQRIDIYPALGFAVEQPIPENVRAAYRRLVDAGFTSRLVSS